MTDDRPLAGRAVVVTRPVEQAAVLADLLAARGALPIVMPLIELVDPDGDIRREAVVTTPLEDRAYQIRRGGRFFHLRITFSEAVSASMKAGRLNSLSAYFISGAACLGNWMP